MNTIFIAIASMADTELIPTIKSALENADEPELLTFSLFVQDEKDPKDKVLKLINKFGAKVKYEFVHLSEARGVGHARYKTQQHLLPKKYKYFLQIDSHTMFIQNWDSKLVKLYEEAKDHWGTFVYSTYPNNYGYKDKEVFYDTQESEPTVRILQDEPNSPSKYSGTPRAFYKGNKFGELTNYFCGGFSFGDSEILYNNKYSPKILYSGEEPYMSILLYANNIKIVAPPRDFVFHDCMGVFENRRFTLFVEQTSTRYKKYRDLFPHFQELEDESYKFLKDFYNGYVDGVFNQKIYNAHLEWAEKFTIPYKAEHFETSFWFK